MGFMYYRFSFNAIDTWINEGNKSACTKKPKMEAVLGWTPSF